MAIGASGVHRQQRGRRSESRRPSASLRASLAQRPGENRRGTFWIGTPSEPRLRELDGSESGSPAQWKRFDTGVKDGVKKARPQLVENGINARDSKRIHFMGRSSTFDH